MRIGLQLPEVERDVRWTEMRDIALTAEDAGFDSLWVGDHLLFRDEETGTRGPLEAWSTLAALAEATHRVDLGPLVAATSFHSPAMLAKKASTIDDISGGRLILGLGAGWNLPEYQAFGFPFDHRVSRFEEAFEIITTLVRDGSIDFRGKYYTIRESELLPRARPDMKIMLGSSGPRMLRIGAPRMDAWNTWHTWYGNTPAGLVPYLKDVDDACHDVGREPTEVERTAAVYVQLPHGEGRIAGSTERPVAEPLRGSQEDIGESLLQFAAMGLSEIQLVVDPIDAAAAAWLAPTLAHVREGLRTKEEV